MSKLDLFDLENNLYNESMPLRFANSTRITTEKLNDAFGQHFNTTD